MEKMICNSLYRIKELVTETSDRNREYYNCLNEAGESLRAEFDNVGNEVQKYKTIIKPVIMELIVGTDDYRTIVLLYSLLLVLYKDIDVYSKFIQYQLKTDMIDSISTRAFLMHQTCRLEFLYSALNTVDTSILNLELNRKVRGLFAKRINDIYSKNTREAANKNLVFIFTDQYIGVNHGPTKIVNSVASVLMRKMRKKVMIINVAETVPLTGGIPMYGAVLGNYDDELLYTDAIEFDGLKIPFFQCDNCMPDVETIDALLNLIRTQSPEYVIDVGSGAISTGIIAQIAPTLTISLVDGIACTDSLCQTFSKPMSYNNMIMVEKAGKNSDYVIYSEPFYSLPKENESHKRNEFGIREEAFLAVTVSARLEEELTEDFWNLMSTISDTRFELLLLGPCSQEYLDKIIQKRPKLRNRVHSLGYVPGVMEYYDMCDLYINPRRLGGGTSAAEALYKRVPVLTFNYGDIANAAGDAFVTENESTMLCDINKYMSDGVFYEVQSQKALERAKILFDKDASLVSVFEEFEKRIPLFYED